VLPLRFFDYEDFGPLFFLAASALGFFFFSSGDAAAVFLGFLVAN
jgi:hypothetical protein